MVRLGEVVVMVMLCWAVDSETAAAGDWPYPGGGGGGGAGPADSSASTRALLNVTYQDSAGAWHNLGNEVVGLFGRGRAFPASGLLVTLVGRDGVGAACTSEVSGTKGVPPGEPWIALVQRGGCPYDLKMNNAWRLSAAAVVVYNNKDSPLLEKMAIADRGNMSGVFITKQQGEELVALVDHSLFVYLNISVGITEPRQYNINRTSVLFVSISFIVLMMISLAWLVFYYVQRFRYIHAKDRMSRRLCSAARKALSKIPTKTIKCDDKEVQGDGECCAVCIEPYKISDILRSLPCRHEFHKSCIDPWLLEHRTCPMCKMDILKHYGFVFTGSQESILHMEIEEVVGLSSPSDPENIPHSSINPRSERQDSNQQSESSRSSSPEDSRPSAHLGNFTVQNVHSIVTEDYMHGAASEGTSQLMICSSCGSNMVARCDAACDTSSTFKEDFKTSNSDIHQECSSPVCNINSHKCSSNNSNSGSCVSGGSGSDHGDGGVGTVSSGDGGDSSSGSDSINTSNSDSAHSNNTTTDTCHSNYPVK